MPLHVDVHTITTLGPNNLNRGETGAPKTITMGGVERQVLSSQSLRKAMRDWVRENRNATVSVRSRRYLENIASRIAGEGASEEEFAEAFKTVAEYMTAAGFIGKVKEGETKNLAIAAFSEDSLEAIAHLASTLPEREEAHGKKFTKAQLSNELKEAMLQGVSLDVALFGTMVAQDKSFNVEASSQVAYALGVTPFRREIDFFTATDDLLDEGENGSAMLGEVEYGASVVYRYATVNVEALAHNLGVSVSEALDSLTVFLEANIFSLPTGFQSRFAARTLPSFVQVNVVHQPTSLVGAFEKAFTTSEEAVEALLSYQEHQNNMFGLTPLHSGSTHDSSVPEILESTVSFIGQGVTGGNSGS